MTDETENVTSNPDGETKAAICKAADNLQEYFKAMCVTPARALEIAMAFVVHIFDCAPAGGFKRAICDLVEVYYHDMNRKMGAEYRQAAAAAVTAPFDPNKPPPVVIHADLTRHIDEIRAMFAIGEPSNDQLGALLASVFDEIAAKMPPGRTMSRIGPTEGTPS